MARNRILAALVGCLALTASRADAGLVVTNTTDANALVAALTANNSGITVTGVTLDARTSGTAMSTGTYAITPGTPTYNITNSGIVLSTGNAAAYSTGPNNFTSNTTAYGVAATPAQVALLQPIGGSSTYFDVTQMTVTFNAAPTTTSINFNVVFGSEEYPSFVGLGFNDSFGLYLNGTNIAFAGGRPINVDHPAFSAIAGTELNGVLAPGGNPLISLSAPLVAGSTGNTFTFILADQGDAQYDTTVYLSQFGGQTVVPEPSSLVLVGLGGLGLLGVRSRRSRSRRA